MSWLYSIVFAGLLFSSGDEVAGPPPSISADRPAVVQDQDVVTERFEQSYPLNPNGRVSVSNVNGSIVVEAWDRNEVRLEAVKIADTREALNDLQIEVDARPDAFSVEVDYDNLKKPGERMVRNHRKLEVQFRLMVPRTAVLDEIETVNGSVTVSNFVNTTKISAVNGNVVATNLRGTANLDTVNGEVRAEFERLEPGSRINLNTVNGRVNLVIPSDANATLKAESLNGQITNDFGLPVRKGRYVGRDLYGRVGTGDVQIKLESVNGGLAINRRSDGRSPNPAVNLLPQKAGDDDDWDPDSHGAVNTARINREIARAQREAQREVQAGMVEAQKAMEKIKIKDLEKLKVEIDGEKLQESIRLGLEEQKLALARLRDINWIGPTIEKKSNSFAVKGTPKVTIEAEGAAVRVRGWDRNEVRYVVTDLATRRTRQPVVVTETQNGSDIRLVVKNPNGDEPVETIFGDPERVRIEVYTPRKSNLKIVTDGEIRLDGVTGDIDVGGRDQSINIRDVEGKMTLAAGDAQVRLIGFKGELQSQTGDGDVYLEGDFQKLSAKAVDGTIFLTLPDTAAASLVSNTEVEADGFSLVQENGRTWRLGQGGPKYSFTFTDGKVVVRNAGLLASY